MSRHLTTISAILLASFALSAPTRAAETGAEIVFSDGELQAIHAFYSESHDGHGGKGHQGGGRQGLPPGIAKNLARGKALPPGLATQSLPPALESSLPPAPDGYERVVVDAKILLVEIATRIISDVIADAVLD